MFTHKGTQTIKTERLTLRRFTPDDAQAMFDTWANDERVTRFLTWPAHESVDVTKFVLDDWCNSYEKQDFYNWAIEFEGKIIGSIGCINTDDNSERGEIGYCIGYDFWGKGIMSEATTAVIDYLLKEVGYNRLEILHATKNPASGRVAQKCGLKFEGIKRKYFKAFNGEFLDVAFYSILQSDIADLGYKIHNNNSVASEQFSIQQKTAEENKIPLRFFYSFLIIFNICHTLCTNIH